MDMGEAGGVSSKGPFRMVRWESEGSMGTASGALVPLGPDDEAVGLGLPVVGNS